MVNPLARLRDRHPEHSFEVMLVLMVAIGMTMLDVSIVNVALPSIQHGLHASGSAIEWIVSGYTLSLGLLLIPAGRIGDNYGHKWTLIGGLSLFVLASLTCSLAQNPVEIITSRFIQGLGAGVYTPSIMAYLQLLYQGPARSRAFAIFGAVIGIATAIGPLLGGLLVNVGGDDFGWRLVFLVNVPVGAALLPFAIKRLPIGRSQREHHHKLDPVGSIVVAVVLVLILFPLVEGRQYNWPWWVWASLGAAALLAIWLWWYEKRLERHNREPLLALHVLRQPSFTFGSLIGLMYFASFTSIFFMLAILWQEGYGHSALASGLMITPFAIGSLIGSSQSDKMSHWLKYNVLVLGGVMVAAGLAWVLVVLHLEGDSFSAWHLTLPLLLAGLGSGIFIAPNQDFTLQSVPHHDAGSAAGMFSTFQRVGSSFGIAAVGTVLFGSIQVGRAGVGAAFTKATEAAMILNIVLIVVTLLLVGSFLYFRSRRA